MADDDVGPDARYALRSVGRALDVLQALGAGPDRDMGLGQVAAAAGLSRSTAFSLLQVMVARGFVADARIGSARRYRLGLALVQLGERAVSDLGITDMAKPVLQSLTHQTGLTSRLAILDEGYAVAIARIDAPGPFRLTSFLGQREWPHCSALGKALLAGLADKEILTLVQKLGMPRRTGHTLTSPVDLLADLRTGAARGYMFDDEEDNAGVLCVGAPVRGRRGGAVAAISVTSLKLGPEERDVHALGRAVRDHADRLSELLGGVRGSSDHPPTEARLALSG